MVAGVKGHVLRQNPHFLPTDVRHKYGCLDVLQELDDGRHIRQCNWVRFLSFASTACESDDANLTATLVDDQPVFRVVRDIPARTLLVARCLGAWLDDAPQCRTTQDVPLDLSTTLWTPPKAPRGVATSCRRLCHRAVLPCGVCGKTFDRPSLLKRHMRTHTGEKPHVCEVCSKGFSTSSSLNTHRRIHSGEKPHECQTCGKRFTASSNLYYHRMTHTKDKPHKCRECGKSFPTPGDLKAHTYIHSGSWPYRCSVCNRGFSKQTNLKNHAFLHTGDRPHPCGICGKKFALVCNLRAHTKTHHQDATSTPSCNQTPYDYPNSSETPRCYTNNLKLQPYEQDATTTASSNLKTSHKTFSKRLDDNEVKASAKQLDLVKAANASFKNTAVNGTHTSDFSRLFNYSDLFFGLSLPLTNNVFNLEELWLKNNIVNSVASNIQSQYCLPAAGGSSHVHPPYTASLSLVDLQAMLCMQADVASILKHNQHVNMSYN